ncbi:MAG: hypothetical protein FWE06_00900 [Oscillospiraceae bacterium]|nr:hypothetical protein [Oscillospiraceae bacterium]
MSAIDYVALIKEQRATKPLIEDVVGSFLEGDTFQNAMDFIKFLRENNMNPRWVSGNSWSISGKKGKAACRIDLGGNKHPWHRHFTVGDWQVTELEGHDRKYLDEFIDCDETKEFIWKNIKPCNRCSCSGPKLDRTYVGKLFPESCAFLVVNPDAKGLEILKKLVVANKRFTPEK